MGTVARAGRQKPHLQAGTLAFLVSLGGTGPGLINSEKGAVCPHEPRAPQDPQAEPET